MAKGSSHLAARRKWRVSSKGSVSRVGSCSTSAAASAERTSLLARDYDTKRVLGIDVDQQLVDHATVRASEEGLSDRLFFKLVQPGPLPIEDVAFDVVFSKDAICHIPDKPAAYAEILRVLRPDGPFVGSDWLKGFDGPLSKDMLYYCEMEA